jgi:hypothetical protein
MSWLVGRILLGTAPCDAILSGHPSADTVTGVLQRPTRELGRAALKRSRTVGSEEPADLGLAPGGVYRAAPVARRAGGLLHHRFTLTRTLIRRGRRIRAAGGLFSVALSRRSPRVGVTHHRALWSPDLPRCDHPKVTHRDRPASSSANEKPTPDRIGPTAWRRRPLPMGP